MKNSVFAKTMENLRKRVNVRLVTNNKKLTKLASKPTYVSSKIFNENLVVVHMIKETLTLKQFCLWTLYTELKEKIIDRRIKLYIVNVYNM